MHFMSSIDVPRAAFRLTHSCFLFAMTSSDSESGSMATFARQQRQPELRALEQRALKLELDNESKKLSDQQKEQNLKSKEADENRERHLGCFVISSVPHDNFV